MIFLFTIFIYNMTVVLGSCFLYNGKPTNCCYGVNLDGCPSNIGTLPIDYAGAEQCSQKWLIFAGFLSKKGLS